MTTRHIFRAALLALLVLGSPAAARPTTTVLSGTVATVGEEVRIGLSLEAVVTSGVGRLGQAVLEWNVMGLSSEEPAEFRLYLAPAAWHSAADLARLRLAETPWVTWTIEGADLERAGGVVRFDLADILAAWRAGDEVNYGLVVVTDALPGQVIERQAQALAVVRR